MRNYNVLSEINITQLPLFNAKREALRVSKYTIDTTFLKSEYVSYKHKHEGFRKEAMIIEEFKDVVGFDGHYQVSNLSRVKSLKRNGEKMLSPSIDKTKGYYRVNLYKNNQRKLVYIHQLVAIAFLGHKPNGNKMVVDHIDNNKGNNRVDNLQVISSRENSSKDQWRRNPSSLFIGVCWSSGKKKWESSISINGKTNHLGYFNNESIAAQEYSNALEYIDEHSSLMYFPFKTNRRSVNESDINQLTFVFVQ